MQNHFICFKKIFPALLLCSLSVSALAADAKWTKFWTSNDGTSYWDENTKIKRYSDGLAIRVMDDLKKPLDLPTLHAQAFSMSVLLVINCNEKTVTLTKVSAYTGHMATGRVLFKDVNEQNSINIMSDTKYSQLYELGCPK